MLSPTLLLEHLVRRLPVLVDGPRDLPPRQQTLRSTIAWSYQLLTPLDKQLFRRLSVFRGGSAIETVAALCEMDEGAGARLLTG